MGASNSGYLGIVSTGGAYELATYSDPLIQKHYYMCISVHPTLDLKTQCRILNPNMDIAGVSTFSLANSA